MTNTDENGNGSLNLHTRKKMIIRIVVTIVVVLLLLSSVSLTRSAAKQRLFSAIDNCDYETVEKILNQYPSLIDENQHSSFAIDVSSNTPLIEACRVSDVKMIELLLEYGADINKSSNVVEAYPITTALQRYFYRKSNWYEVTWILIENGADLNVDSYLGTVPYLIVTDIYVKDDEIEQQKAVELLDYVIEQGVSLDAPSWTYCGAKSLLGVAAASNQSLCCQYLIDNGYCNVNEIVDENGRTSLMLAAKQGSYGACMLLLEYGADKSLTDDSGKTAYDYAVENGKTELEELLKP